MAEFSDIHLSLPSTTSVISLAASSRTTRILFSIAGVNTYVLTTPTGEQFLFKVHRRPHAGRMRRFLYLAELLAARKVPHPAVRWSDVDRQTLPVPYYIQDANPIVEDKRSPSLRRWLGK